jgi:hypothetical protein
MTKTATPAFFQFRAKRGANVWRDFEIEGSDTLEQLAQTILDAYDFDCDHRYGFYSKLKGNKAKSDEICELFVDQDAGSPNENARGVYETLIKDVFFSNKQMLFFFDYGDEWEFHLKCIDIVLPKPKVKYTRVIGSKGDAPERNCSSPSPLPPSKAARMA